MYIIYSIQNNLVQALPIKDDNDNIRTFTKLSDVAKYLSVSYSSASRAITSYSTIRGCKIRKYTHDKPMISKTLPMSEHNKSPRFSIYNSEGNNIAQRDRHMGLSAVNTYAVCGVNTGKFMYKLTHGKPIKINDLFVLEISVGYVPDTIDVTDYV